MLNFLIRILTKWHKPINGNPNEWLERNWPINKKWREFHCGSCRGLYKANNKEFEVLAVHNTKRNDDFNKVLDRFEKSCQREGYNLSFLEVGNPKLREKLLRLGFVGEKEKMTRVYDCTFSLSEI